MTDTSGVGLQTRGATGTIVLISPPMRPEQAYGEFADWGSISPPTGLCYMAAVLREHGYRVAIIDAEAEQLDERHTVARCLELNPDVVGLSCKTLWVVGAHRVAVQLKGLRPALPIVVGGNHPSGIPERTLREFPCFDYVVRGEGELTLLELLRALNAGSDLREVKGLTLRLPDGQIHSAPARERIADLDTLPPPAFDLLPELKTHYIPPLNTLERLPAFSVIFSRGCPAHCTFCDKCVFHSRVTKHSPEYIVRVLKNLYYDHGIRYLLFDDDNLLLNEPHLFRVLDLLEESGMDLRFTCQSRVDTISPQRLARLKRAGCRQILYGIESGSQTILDAMHKGITVAQIREAVAMTRRAGIRVFGFFIVGFPGETRATLDETLALIAGCDFDDIAVFPFTPMPGSEVYPGVERHGTFTEDWERMNAMDEILYIPNGLDAATLRDYTERAYGACYRKWRQMLRLPLKIHTRRHARAYWNGFRQVVFPPRKRTPIVS